MGFKALLLTILVVATGCATTEKPVSLSDGQRSRTELEDRFGVEVRSLRLSAGGYMLDFRYMVRDADAAKALFNPKVKPYLMDHKSGGKFLVPDSPKVGALRQSTEFPVAGKQYFMFFANPGGFLKRGSEVTVVIGDFRAENLVVE